jgi:thiaminase/transcriptional activator TenA
MVVPPNVRLERKHAREWSALLRNPFVEGLGTGALPRDAFRLYLSQDALYLDMMMRALLAAAARSPRMDFAARIVRLVQDVLSGELLDEDHGAFAADAGISPEVLRQAAPDPITSAYGHFLQVTAWTDSLLVFLGALLPCVSSYRQIGRALRGSPGARAGPYRRWIAFYASSSYAREVREYEAMFNDLWRDASRAERRRADASFTRSVEYERLFWAMASGAEVPRPRD